MDPAVAKARDFVRAFALELCQFETHLVLRSRWPEGRELTRCYRRTVGIHTGRYVKDR
jgi:hypothetical protein